MNLDRETGLRFLHGMLRIRRFEEKCAELYGAEKIRGFLHLYIGEEAIAVGAMPAFTAEDAIVSHYRDHGHALARGLSMRSLMAEMFGKVEGCSRGRGGSMHLFDAQSRFYGGHAIVGALLPMSVGLALADKLLRRPQVTGVFFGDGAAAEGEFQESLNLAALWRLPVLFACENNLYAMGTALERTHAQTSLLAKARALGVTAEEVDGMDVMAVAEATRKAAAAVRSGDGPHFLELHTYRFRGHSMFDAQLYRSKEEVEKWMKRDPIDTFRARLEKRGLLTAADAQRLEAGVAAEVEDAVAFAEAGQLEPVEELTRFVYAREAPR